VNTARIEYCLADPDFPTRFGNLAAIGQQDFQFQPLDHRRRTYLSSLLDNRQPLGKGAVVADIFITYARDDDLAPPDNPDRKGFATFLDESIRYQFRNLGPKRPTIWRDTKRISDGDQFTPEIEEALKNASLLLVVLSPNWMASKWCRRELDTFAGYHGPDDIRERIIVVSKGFVDLDERPPLLQGQTGFAFYVRNADAGEISTDVEYFDRGEARDQRYWNKLNELVACLLRHQAPPPPPPPPYPPTGRIIYVAKPASDMRAGYDRIVSELVGKGHTVVPTPSEDIPLGSAVAVIDEALSKAEISVHLLGEKAGEAPEEQAPLVKLQLERAAAKAGKDNGATFHRILWAPSLWSIQPDATQPPREITRRPLDVLDKFDSQFAGDKVEGDSLSKFVDFLNQHLIVIAPRPAATALPAINGGARLYLYHSQEDSEYALSLARALQQRQMEALLPAFDGPDVDIKSFNGKQLAECDAVILCWASASEVWVRAYANGLRNWHDLGRTQQFSYRAVVAAPPPGSRKKAGDVLFPRSEIDIVVDFSDRDVPTADLLDQLVPAAHANAP
jgi:hypothetical protein